MADADDPVPAGDPDDASLDAGEEDVGWPVLSDLDLDVCVTDASVPGLILRPAGAADA